MQNEMQLLLSEQLIAAGARRPSRACAPVSTEQRDGSKRPPMGPRPTAHFVAFRVLSDERNRPYNIFPFVAHHCWDFGDLLEHFPKCPPNCGMALNEHC